jgi:hypothetical protein
VAPVVAEPHELEELEPPDVVAVRGAQLSVPPHPLSANARSPKAAKHADLIMFPT